MKNIIKVVFVIIGSLIGAGFASGQEIYLFFFSYGINGIIGIIISSTLIGIVTKKSLKIIKQYNIQTYKQFLEIIINTKRKNTIKLINLIVNTFILATFFIMIAGFGTYLEQEYGINKIVGSIILAIITFIILNKNIKGVVKANEIIVPILIILITIIGLINLTNIPLLEIKKYTIQNNNPIFILQAILYASYNSILLIPILITLNKYIKSNKQINIISIISTLIIILLSILIYLLLTKVDVNIEMIEMPAVYVVSNMFKIFKYIYGFIILGSIFTTTISLGVSFLQNINKKKLSYTQIAALMCITSTIISNIGFSNLVNSLYPIFGYLGILQIWKIKSKK